MNIVYLLENPILANLLVTLAAQSILISLLGMLFLKWAARKPAPVRALACVSTIAAMCLVLLVSIGFRMSGAAWYKFDFANLWPKSALSANKPLLDIHPVISPSTQTLPPAMANIIKSREMQSPQPHLLPAKAGVFINAFGILWIGGFLFLLLKLGYGLIFLKGFRFGLVQAADNKFDGIVRIAAGAFQKSRLPELYTSPKMESPITIGLFKPIVILPEKLYRTLSDNELKCILLHELAHIYHYDHLAGVIKRIFLAIYWWNPLAYWINAEHDMAREEVSDNYVLSELDPKEYSKCLAALAEKVSLVNSLPATAGMAGRHFNLLKRVENILSPERSLAMRASLNLKLMTIAACTVLILFITGLQAQVALEKIGIMAAVQQNSDISSSQAAMLGVEGSKLTPEQAAELEKIVARNPDDLKSQTLLLGYYFSNRFKDQSCLKKDEQTVLWLIQNHPDAAVLGTPYGQLLPMLQNYGEEERLWKEQLRKRPNDLHVISNAARSFIQGNIDLAIETFKQGKSLDPGNTAAWDRELGNCYKLKGNRSSAQEAPLLAKEALTSFESADAETKVKNRSQLLPSLAKAALAAGDINKAISYANQMLASTDVFVKGDMIYNGNFVLGMVAVKNGNLDAAEKYLLASADTPGSPVLNSFGPNMSLAKELLERGRRDAVLAFLKKCLKFWNLRRPNMSSSFCSQWIQEMEEGGTPNFFINLNY